MNEARIIQFPERRTCYKCVYYLWEVSECFLFAERIYSESEAARHCPSYEVDDDQITD